MTRSIFDPTGGNTEHSGSTHTGPQASDRSRMPEDVVDGEARDARDAGAGDARSEPIAADADEAAQRLDEMTRGDADPA